MEFFVEIYAVFCSTFVWRKSLWRKNDKYEICLGPAYSFPAADVYSLYTSELVMHKLSCALLLLNATYWVSREAQIRCRPRFSKDYISHALKHLSI